MYRYQWGNVHDPESNFTLFDEEGEGESVVYLPTYSNEECSESEPISGVKTMVGLDNSLEISWNKIDGEIGVRIIVYDVKKLVPFDFTQDVVVTSDGKYRVNIDPTKSMVSTVLGESEKLIINDEYLTEYQYELESYCSDQYSQKLVARTGGFEYKNQGLCVGHTSRLGHDGTDGEPKSSVNINVYNFSWESLKNSDIGDSEKSKTTAEVFQDDFFELTRTLKVPVPGMNDIIQDIGKVAVKLYSPVEEDENYLSQCVSALSLEDRSGLDRIAYDGDTLHLVGDEEFSMNPEGQEFSDGVDIYTLKGSYITSWPREEPDWFRTPNLGPLALREMLKANESNSSVESLVEDRGEGVQQIKNVNGVLELASIMNSFQEPVSPILDRSKHLTYGENEVDDFTKLTYGVKTYTQQPDEISPQIQTAMIQYHPSANYPHDDWNEKINTVVKDDHILDFTFSTLYDQLRDEAIDRVDSDEEIRDYLDESEDGDMIKEILKKVEDEIGGAVSEWTDELSDGLLGDMLKYLPIPAKSGDLLIQGGRQAYVKEVDYSPKVKGVDESWVQFVAGAGLPVTMADLEKDHEYQTYTYEGTISRMKAKGAEEVSQFIEPFKYQIVVRSRYDLNFQYEDEKYKISNSSSGFGVAENVMYGNVSVRMYLFSIKVSTGVLRDVVEWFVNDGKMHPGDLEDLDEFIENCGEDGYFAYGYQLDIPFEIEFDTERFTGYRDDNTEVESDDLYNDVAGDINRPRWVATTGEATFVQGFSNGCEYGMIQSPTIPSQISSLTDLLFGPYLLYPVPSQKIGHSFDALQLPHFNYEE